MKNNVITLNNIIILVLLIIIVVQYCSPPKTIDPNIDTIIIDGKEHEVLDRKSDTTDIIKIDTGTNTNLIPKEIIYRDKVVEKIVEKFVDVDTTEILRDYFAKKVYSDVIYFADSLGNISIVDTVSENRITSRTHRIEYTERTIDNTIIVKEPKRNEIYYGFKTALDKNQLVSSVSTGLLIKNKREKIISLNVGIRNNAIFNDNIEPYVEGGLFWKIKLGKKR
jgi:hypothetical protein